VFGSFGSRAWEFRLLGFPVRVDMSFWFLAVLLGLGSQDVRQILIWVSVVFVSILAHELGHAAMGRRFGLQGSIELYSMGGLTRWVTSRSLTHGQDITIGLAGPLTGLAIGGTVWATVHLTGWPESFYHRVIVGDLLWVNIGWGLLNLLPIEPLDGGHVVASTIHWIRGYRDEALPLLVSVIFGGAAVATALIFGMMWGALLAGLFTFRNVTALRQYGQIRPRDKFAALMVFAAVAAGMILLFSHLGWPGQE